MKGSGGNLGFTTLSELAGIVETKLKQNNTMNDKDIDDLQALIDDVASDYAKLDSPNQLGEQSALREESPDYVLSKMDEILDNLSKDVFSSEAALKDLLECSLETGIVQEVEMANKAMSKFDIDLVGQSILKAKTSFQSSLSN